jgi:O-antigen ligase
MADVGEPKLSPRAKIAGALGIGFGFFAGAGVTGLSMLVAILGIWAWIVGLRGQRPAFLGAVKASLKKNVLAWLSFVGFFGWVMITAFWSPATELAGESVRRITVMVLLTPIVVWAVASQNQNDAQMFRRALVAGLVIAGTILLFEVISGASLNKIASPEKEMLAINGDLGRAATASLALFWAGFACIHHDYGRGGVLVIFVMICGFLSFQFGTDLNAVGLIAGSVMALITLRFSRFAIGLLSGGVALLIMIAPVFYVFAAKLATGLMPDGVLPLSYARRAQMWEVSSQLIAQKPLTGWGVGAGSTFDRVISYGGFDWPLIQLHPHAAPLHIWLETGAIGASLASLAILFAGLGAISTIGRNKVAAAALVGGLTFLAIQWGFSHAAWREWMWVSFAMVVAAALSLRRLKAPVQPTFAEDLEA